MYFDEEYDYDMTDAFLEGYSDAILEMEQDSDYEDAYLEGYYAALNEETKSSRIIAPTLRGGDIAGDLKNDLGIGSAKERASAVKKYLKDGNTIKAGLLQREYGMDKEGTMYRKNRFFNGNQTVGMSNRTAQELYRRLSPEDRAAIMKNYTRKKK